MAMPSMSKHASDHTRKCGSQPIAKRQLGNTFNSPQKSWRTGTKERVSGLANDFKLRALSARIATLKAPPPLLNFPSPPDDIPPLPSTTAYEEGTLIGTLSKTSFPQPAGSSSDLGTPCSSPSKDRASLSPGTQSCESPALPQHPPKKKHHTNASQKARNQYHRWQELVPVLVGLYLRHVKKTYQAVALPPVPDIINADCSGGSECSHQAYSRTVVCLFMHRKCYCIHTSTLFLINI